MAEETTTNTQETTVEQPQKTQQHDWEKRYKDMQDDYQHTKNKLRSLEQQVINNANQQQTPKFDAWDDPNKMFDMDRKSFSADLDKYLDHIGMPEQVRIEIAQTIFKAREINQRDFKQRFDKIAGYDNALDTMVKYLSEKYSGDDLQRRINALQSDDYYELEAKRTLEEMKANGAGQKSGTSEPSPLPDSVTTAHFGVTPLDPSSAECSALMSDPKYRDLAEPQYRENILKRIEVWSKANKGR